MPVTIRDPYAVPGAYRKAQLHCHTTASDGRFRPRELLRMYKDAGYAFVVITDHNRVTREDSLNDATFLALPGTEDTVSRLRPFGPHMARLFVAASLPPGRAQEYIDRTAAEGGLAALCHPSWRGNLGSGAWSTRAVTRLRGYPLIEIWNAHSDSRRDVARWEAALAARSPAAPLWGVAVDDCHRAGQFNRGWIMARVAAVTAEALRAALAGGAFYASTGPDATFRVDGTTITAAFSEPVEAWVLDDRGRVRAQQRGREIRCAPAGDERYLRVEARSARGRVWSQPFWLVPAESPSAGAAACYS